MLSERFGRAKDGDKTFYPLEREQRKNCKKGINRKECGKNWGPDKEVRSVIEKQLKSEDANGARKKPEIHVPTNTLELVGQSSTKVKAPQHRRGMDMKTENRRHEIAARALQHREVESDYGGFLSIQKNDKW